MLALVPVLVKLTVLVDWLAPKPVPEIVTAEPTVAIAGLIPETESVSTENETELLVTPASSTVTGPLVAPLGTPIVILVSLQE